MEIKKKGNDSYVPIPKANYFQENQEKIESAYLESIYEHKFLGFIAVKIMKYSSIIMKKKGFDIIKTINSNKIDFLKLRKLCFDGIPDDLPSLRSLLWKIFFKEIPLNINEWEEVIEEKRSKYNSIKDNIMVKLELDHKKHSEEKSKKSLKGTTPKRVTLDHPLSMNSESKWKSYFDDLVLLEEVEKDVRRTRSHMHFFMMPANNDKNKIFSNEEISYLADKKRNDNSTDNSKNKLETNSDVLARILFIYAKLYPEIRYVQGMNEILAPIYYCFSLDNNPYFSRNVEADSFVCFEQFMDKIKDIFIRKKDNTDVGINSKLNKISDILRIIDKELYSHLLTEKIEMQFFAFRWYTLFLTQEFELPDILRFWDSLLTVEDIFEFIGFVCISIIKLKRTDIISKDFSGIMLTLQNLENLNLEKIIQYAIDLRESYCNETINSK
jgi:hypothetical protein